MTHPPFPDRTTLIAFTVLAAVSSSCARAERRDRRDATAEQRDDAQGAAVQRQSVWPASAQLERLYVASTRICARVRGMPMCWTLPPHGRRASIEEGVVVEADLEASLTVSADQRSLDVIADDGGGRLDLTALPPATRIEQIVNFGGQFGGVYGPFHALTSEGLWTLSTSVYEPTSPRLSPSRLDPVYGLDLRGARLVEYGLLITARGEIWAWGDNSHGRADPTTYDWAVVGPRKLSLPGPASDAYFSLSGGCALVRSDVYCWGHTLSSHDDIRPAASEVPPADCLPKRIEGLPSGPKRFPHPGAPCVLTDRGEAFCWNPRREVRRLGEHVEHLVDGFGRYCMWGDRVLRCVDYEYWHELRNDVRGDTYLVPPR